MATWRLQKLTVLSAGFDVLKQTQAVCHSEELPFVFQPNVAAKLNGTYNAAEIALSDSMQQ